MNENHSREIVIPSSRVLRRRGIFSQAYSFSIFRKKLYPFFMPYYVYITTNPGKTVLYIGVTNSLERRMEEHFSGNGNSKSFTGRYHCYNLIYCEEYKDIGTAIAREKQLKGWRRAKKMALIKAINPNLNFLHPSDL